MQPRNTLVLSSYWKENEALVAVVKGNLSYLQECAISEKDGSMALVFAARYNKQNIVEYLLTKDYININHLTGKTALMWAAINNNIEIAALLLTKGASINTQDELGKTALIYAAAEGNEQIARYFIENWQADIEIKSNMFRWNALTTAAQNNNANIVKLLLDKKAKINEIDRYGNTALIHASIKGHFEIVKLLISHKADIEIRNNNQKQAIDIAREYNHPSIVDFLSNQMLEEHSWRRLVISRSTEKYITSICCNIL